MINMFALYRMKRQEKHQPTLQICLLPPSCCFRFCLVRAIQRAWSFLMCRQEPSFPTSWPLSSSISVGNARPHVGAQSWLCCFQARVWKRMEMVYNPPNCSFISANDDQLQVNIIFSDKPGSCWDPKKDQTSPIHLDHPKSTFMVHLRYHNR